MGFFTKIVGFIENKTIIQCVKRGLVMTMPALIIGSMALVLITLPIPMYQSFVNDFMGGLIIKIATFIYDATFRVLSIYFTFNISISYAQKLLDKGKYILGAPIVSLGAFMIFIGMNTANTAYVEYLGVIGMFSAILSATLGSYIYTFLANREIKLFNAHAEGMDILFNDVILIIVPIAVTLLIVSLVNYTIQIVFKVTCFQELFITFTNGLFNGMGRGLLSEILFVFLSSIMWFFGIHGSNLLENVSQNLFVPGLEINIANIANGLPATEIVSKTFFDTFVIMGGSGTVMCLLLAILFFSKRKSSHSLAKISAFPMIFNISEPIMFGLPVIFNPVLFIPFICTPIICTLISYTAMYIGLVPLCTADVEWTTPVLLSGYIATGSVRGSILQLFNLIIGIVIYRPFIMIYDDEKSISMKQNVGMLNDILIKNEAGKKNLKLSRRNDSAGDVFRMLIEDLKYAILHDELNVYYQPQYDNLDRCIGAEALLRWNHSVCGMMYPPLVIKLAEEGGFLNELENKIFDIVLADIKNTFDKINANMKICINISAATLQSDGFEDMLEKLKEKHKIKATSICIEVTEQMTLNFNSRLKEKINRIKEMGFSMAIDDFSMGHTSLEYLKISCFDMVKLDGSLIRGMSENSRCENIIESIVSLGQSLGFDVLAEYVETKEQRSSLENIGCNKYQGYLFSPAIPIERMVEKLKEK